MREGGAMKLCEKGKDSIVDLLFDGLRANVLRIPRPLEPLSVIARNGKRAVFRGSLNPLLDSPVEVSASLSDCPSISSRRSSQISLEIGVKLLEGMLAGFGCNAAGLAARLAGSQAVSFSFENVVRSAFDVNELGLALAGKELRSDNPAFELFVGPAPWEALLVDACLASNAFSLHVERTHGAGLELSAAELQDLLGASAKLAVSVSSSRSVTFRADTALTFAFSCIRMGIGTNRVVSLRPAETGIVLEPLGIGARPAPEHTILADRETLSLEDG